MEIRLLRKSGIMLAAFLIMAVSVYFNIDFFIWWGFNQFFSVLISIIVVCLMDSIFQTLAWAFRAKKTIAWLLLPVWLIFFGSSIFGTYVGMNYKSDHARQIRIDTAQKRIQGDPALETINQQIATMQKTVDGFQAAYDIESNWWIKDVKIKPALMEAQKEFTARIEEKKALYAKQGADANKRELFSNSSGEIDPVLKGFLAILFGFLIDMGSCIILCFSWIFDKKEERTENKIESLPTTIQQAPIKTIDDYIDDYIKARVNGSTVLRGRTSREVVGAGIPPSIYSKITIAALDCGLIETTGKVTQLNFGIGKETLQTGLKDYFTEAKN
jgi:hypothetical protein